MKRLLKIALGLVLLLAACFAALVVGTSGNYPVAALVTQDPSLPSVDIAGVRLHVEVHEGPEGADTIIVLHGGPGADFLSLTALADLSETHNVVLYDQRGAGLSERVGPDRLGLDGHLEELEALAEFLSPDRPVILIGHSWGASLASAFMGDFPDRVQSAVLIEPGYLDAAGRAAWLGQAQAYLAGGAYLREAVLTGFRARHVTGPDASAADDYLIGHMVGVFVNHPENPYHCGDGYSAPMRRFGAASSDHWDTVPASEVDRISRGTAFAGPVLFLSGACNDWIGPPLQDQHAARFANAKAVTIPEAGHDVVWDNPAETLRAIRAFLASAPSGG